MRKEPTTEQKVDAIQRMTKRDIQLVERNLSKFRAYTNENIGASKHRQRSWSVPGVAERDMPRFSREEAIQKGRQLVEEFPIVAGLVQTLVDNVVSNGFRLSMQTSDPGWNKENEAWWEEKKDTLDIRGVRSGGQLQRLWQTRKIVDGDVGVYLYQDQAANEFYTQTIEADRIRCKKYDYIDQGVKYDTFGRPVSYFIGPRPKDQLDFEKMLAEGKEISAKDFLLYAHFPGERADALRGTSALLQNFNLLRDIAEIMQAVIQKAKNEAFIGLLFTMEPTPSGKIFGDMEEVKGVNGKKKRAIKMAAGLNLNLSPGEKAEVLESKTPHGELMPFIRFLLRYGGSAYGMPLEMMLLDVSDTNWSGGRVILELAKRRFRVEQDALASLNTRVFRAAQAFEVAKKDGLRPPKTLKNYWAHRWGRPVMPYIDPSKEASANRMLLEDRLDSPQGVIGRQSDRDPDEILNDWVNWDKSLKDKDLQDRTKTAPVVIESAPQETQKKKPEVKK